MKNVNQDVEDNLRRPENWAAVWAEIAYLDSASEYREYLDQNEPASNPPVWGFVLLDSTGPRSKSTRPMYFVIVVGLVLLSVGAYLLYRLLDALR